MNNSNCNCSGNRLDRFYSLFTCDRVCANCKWIVNNCCNGCNSDTITSSNSNSNCLNYYDIDMQSVIKSKIHSFGYCDNFKALGIQYANGEKKLYMNVDKSVYNGLLDLNKDLLFMFLQESLTTENQCISVSSNSTPTSPSTAYCSCTVNTNYRSY